MAETIKKLRKVAMDQGMELGQLGAGGVWVLRTSRGVFDIGPTPTRGPEWWSFFLNLKAAGLDVPTKESDLSGP